MGSEHLAYEGPFVVLEYARTANGQMPAKEHFHRLDASDQVKIQRIWNYVSQNPNWGHPHKFKKVEGETNLWEIKSFQQRMFAAWASRRSGTKRRLLLICGLSVPKKHDRLKRAELERARRIRDEHFQCWEQ